MHSQAWSQQIEGFQRPRLCMFLKLPWNLIGITTPAKPFRNAHVSSMVPRQSCTIFKVNVGELIFKVNEGPLFCSMDPTQQNKYSRHAWTLLFGTDMEIMICWYTQWKCFMVKISTCRENESVKFMCAFCCVYERKSALQTAELQLSKRHICIQLQCHFSVSFVFIWTATEIHFTLCDYW